MTWVWSQLRDKAASTTTQHDIFRSDASIPAKRHRMDDGIGQQRRLVDSADHNFDPDSISTMNLFPATSQSHDLVLRDACLPDFDFLTALRDGSLDALPLSAMPDDMLSSHLGSWGHGLDELTESLVLPAETTPRQLSSTSDDSGPQTSQDDLDVYSSFLQLPENCFTSQRSGSSTQSKPVRKDSTSATLKRRRTERPSPLLSPFSVDQAMIDRSNQHAISTNLLQIYNDVIEHNLSCWATEATCPYEAQRWHSGHVDTPNTIAEWRPSWSNRIYRRTVKLDRVARSTNMIQLTRSEDEAAWRALNLAIMAFATQWMEGSHRKRQRYSTLNETLENMSENFAAEITRAFDRDLRRNFWQQAQRALEDVAHLESYRVVCAEMIFGLTQKPWESDDCSVRISVEAVASENDRARVGQASMLSQLGYIMSKEGPPIYLERAVRKVQALKFRYDSLTRGVTRPAKEDRKTRGPNALQTMTVEDRSTVGLWYWLAVMTDTLSSSMYERPVVLPDEDCRNGADQENLELNAATDPDELRASRRWRIDRFTKDNLDQPCQLVHWPCSYEAAADAVTKSAPIKVLLFRYISYLQNSLRKGSCRESVEKLIRNATSIYRYWNITYGAFFRELVQHYDKVPQRIQGWFFCISAHWHLAAMMLADLIEYIDENELGETSDARSRTSSKMVSRIREASARELSDLARVATPPDEEAGHLATPQLPDFHHAVNEGTFLTEPWTMILIKAFTKAALMLLGEADDFLRYGQIKLGHNTQDFKASLEQGEECIRVLWYLGKKSDMAREVAEILSSTLGKLSI